MAEPGLSIRTRLASRARRWLLLAVAGWCSFVATVLLPGLPAWLMVGSFVLTCAALLVMILGLRCPHCRHSLTQAGLLAALMPAQASQSQCGGCKRSLDQSE